MHYVDDGDINMHQKRRQRRRTGSDPTLVDVHWPLSTTLFEHQMVLSDPKQEGDMGEISLALDKV